MDLYFQQYPHHMLRLIQARKVSIKLQDSDLLDEHPSAIMGSEGTGHSTRAELWLLSRAPVVLVLFINCDFEPYNPS